MITAVIPHYAYARSDKKDASRISLGGRLVADLISTAGADRVLTMNLHAPQVHGFFSVPVDHLTALGVLADHFREQDLDNAVVVSPDLGNAKDATQFSRLLGLPVAAGSKRGSATTGSSSTRSSATSRASGPSCSTTRSPPAARSSSCSTGSPTAAVTEAAVACTHGLFAGQGRRAAARPPDDQRGRHHRHRSGAAPAGPSSRCVRSQGCSPRRSSASTRASRCRACSTASTRRTPRPASGRCSTGCAREPCPPGGARRRARAALRGRGAPVARRGGRRRPASCARAAPFLVGTAAGWLLASLTLDSGPRSLAFGAVVVVCTVVLGMLLRRVAGEGTALSFVIVATSVLTVLLLGWRLVARLVD